MVRNLILLARPVMSVLAGITVIVGSKLSVGHWVFSQALIFAAISMICLTGLAMVWDAAFDPLRGGPKKGLYGFVKENQGDVFVWAFILIGISSILINSVNELSWIEKKPVPEFVTTYLLSVFLTLGYPKILGSKPGIPNAIVAFYSALAIVIGGYAVGFPTPTVWFVALLIFFVLFSREILKDFEDIEVDKGFKATFPLWNHRAARFIIAVSCVLSVFLVWWLSHYFSGFFWPIIAVFATFFFGIAVFQTFAKKESQAKNWLTIAMFLLVVGVALA